MVRLVRQRFCEFGRSVCQVAYFKRKASQSSQTGHKKKDARCGGFLELGVPPNHPKSNHFSIETYGFGDPPVLSSSGRTRIRLQGALDANEFSKDHEVSSCGTNPPKIGC